MEPEAAQGEKETKREEVYLSWTSPSRLFKHRDKDFFTNIAAIVFLLTVILVFAREYLLILALLSIAFLVYVLSTVPPEEVKHRITNLGIESVGHFYRWEERIIILLAGQDRAKVRELVAKNIPFREQPEKSWVDNAAHWLTEKIPLEKPAS